MGLKEYWRKRRFDRTPEPAGRDAAPRRAKASAKAPAKARTLSFVIQKHRATALHYDFRLEWDGVLLSWAVPKGPSLDPSVKRFAQQVEDHPLDYADFEGMIPEGQYGGGTVMVWDRGTYVPEGDMDQMLARGDVKVTLDGDKVRGSFVLVRTKGLRGSSSSRGPAWLLIKHRDAEASTHDVTLEKPCSAVTGRSLAQIARDEGGNVEKAATGDPPGARCRSRAAASKKARRKK
jgi:bifunctional non-homologous end joining protein LigD